MQPGIVCFPIDQGPSRLMLFDLGRGAGVPLPVGLWIDSLASWDEGLLVWGWPAGTPVSTVWTVDPSGTPEPFGPLAGRSVHGMDVGPDGTVVVGIPYEGADWFHRGTNLLVCAPDGSEPRLVYEGRLLLWYPTIGPDGSIAVLEQPKGRRKRLLVVRPDGSVERPPLKEELGPHWGPQRVFWGASGLLAVEGRLGRNDDSGSLAMAILDDRFRLAGHFEEFRPHGWSPDGSALLVTHRGRRLFVLTAPEMNEAWTVGPPYWPMPLQQATWLPAALAARFGQAPTGPPDRGPDLDFSTFRTTIIPARKSTPPASPFQVVGADSLGSHGTVRVQLRGGDPARLAAVLTSAAADLIRLDTTEPEGEVETPSFVSDVQAHPAGPWVWIDANDTEAALLDRIPTILQRHLEAAAITDAVIDLDPDV